MRHVARIIFFVCTAACCLVVTGSVREDGWRQIHEPAPDGKTGVLTVSREQASAESSVWVRPQWVKPEGVYIFTDAETGIDISRNGQIAREIGFPVALPRGVCTKTIAYRHVIDFASILCIKGKMAPVGEGVECCSSRTATW